MTADRRLHHRLVRFPELPDNTDNIMDNFTIDISGEGEGTLAKALEIAFAHNAPGGKATHYNAVRLKEVTRYYSNPAGPKLAANLDRNDALHIHHFNDIQQADDGDLTLVLCWHESKESTPLPFPLGIADAINFVKGWLTNAGDPGSRPDHDGDNGAGWRVFTGAWGHVAGNSYGIVGVQAIWAMYGK